MMKRSIAAAGWLLLPLVLLGGCGVELVGGAEHGDVQTTMRDDPSSDQPHAYRAPAKSLGESPAATQQVVDVEGRVSADVAVALLDADGDAVPVTSSAATGEVRIASSESSQLGYERVLVGVYPAVRLTFTRVEVELDAGPVGSSIEVDLGTPLVVEVPVQLRVRRDDLTRIEVDLNAALWLPLADPVTGVVARAAFANAVGVRVTNP
jgi:hypothetical protein